MVVGAPMPLTPSTWSPRARGALWQGLLLFGIVLSVRGCFALEPPGRDQGLFWTQAELLLRGARLYDQVWEHKPPGIVALYAAARALSPSYLAVHLLNGLAVLATAWLLCALCRRRGLSRAGALFAAIAYALFAAGPAFGGYWMIAQPEVFLDPLLAAALWLMAAPSLAAAIGAGVAIGTAVAWLKYSAFPLVLLVVFVPARDARGVRAQRGRLSFLLGCGVPAAVLLAYFAATGRALAWFDATIRFNLEHARIGRSSFWSDPIAYGLPLIVPLLAFYVFTAVAKLDRLTRRAPVASDGLLYLGGATWLLALLQVVVQGKFWTYHYHVLLLPFSILAGVGFERACARWTPRLGARRAFIASSALAVLACAGYFAQVGFYAGRHDLLAALSGETSEESFSLRYTWGRDDYNFGVDRVVAAKLRATTEPKDRILIWGFEPVIYTLAQRAPATRFLYDYPLMPRFSSHERFVRQLLSDLHAHPPAQILVLRDDTNDLEREDSATQLAAIPELARYVERGYAPTWSAGKFTCYARR
jgi:hypothetical protein